jgi:hypothetical protein
VESLPSPPPPNDLNLEELKMRGLERYLTPSNPLKSFLLQLKKIKINKVHSTSPLPFPLLPLIPLHPMIQI